MVMLILVVALSGLALAIVMSGPNASMNCPMEHGGSLCPIGLDYVALWQGTLAVTKDGIRSFAFLLMVSALLGAVVIRLHLEYSPSLALAHEPWKKEKGRHDSNRFGYLRAALAQGILQPKIFY